MTDVSKPDHPSLSEATRVWARIAALSVGGPAGQIAVMHQITVEEKRWLGDDRFLHALNFCTLLPGPEAQKLATCIGWLMHGVRGALLAGVLFILPGVAAIMAPSRVYAIWGDVGLIAGPFFGLKAAVLAIVVQAVVRVGKRTLKNRGMNAIALASFVAIFVFGVPWMERLRKNTALSSALSAVTAAVVGVILNLAIWFALHVVWREVAQWRSGPVSVALPMFGTINWAAAALSALALVAVFRWKLGMVSVLDGSALLGVALYFAGLT